MNDSIPALERFIEPTPVPFAFGAPGWYVVGSLVLLLLVLMAILVFRNYYKNRYRRTALRQLQQQATNLIGQQQYTHAVYMANMLMKQICIKLYSRELCADLRGKDWLHFLNETSHPGLFQEENEKVLSSLYLSNNDIEKKDANAFINKAEQWIKQHNHAISHRK